MKLVCIDDVTDILGFGNGVKELTYGKSYKVIAFYEKKDGRHQQIRIINDLGVYNDYRLDRFVSLERWREIQINKILG
jgi:hypothetical protein